MSLNSTWVFSQLRMTLAKILVEFSPESPANEGRAHSMIWLVQIGWIKTIQTFSSDGGITWLVTRYFDVKIRMLGFWPMPKFSCAHDVRLCVKINIGYLGTSILSDGLPFFPLLKCQFWVHSNEKMAMEIHRFPGEMINGWFSICRLSMLVYFIYEGYPLFLLLC